MTASNPSVASDLVSVIIPAYRVTEYIGDALTSLMKQTHRHFEAIVVNDGCPDTVRLEAVLEPFRDRITYIKQVNQGVAGARNTAIRASSGTYIALLDADDIWEPFYLERQLAFLQAHPECDLVYPDAVLFGDTHLAGRRYMEVTPSRGEVTVESLLAGACNVFISVLGRREIFLRAGLFDPRLRAAEDFELWVRMLLVGGRIGYHREVLARRRKHDQSLSADRATQARRGLLALERLLAHPNVSPRQVELIRNTARRFQSAAELWDGKRALVECRAADALIHFKRANEAVNSRKLALVIKALQLAPGVLQRCYALRNRFVTGTTARAS